MAAQTDPTRVAKIIALSVLFAASMIFSLFASLALVPLWLLVRAAAKLFRPDLGPIISDASTLFTVYQQEECPASINHYLILEGKLEVERLRELFHERVMTARRPNGDLMFPHFRNTWTEFLGYSFWRPEKNFSLARHIREYDLEGDLKLSNPCNEEDLKRVIGGIAAKLYRGDRSPWEILLIPNYIDKEGSKGPKTVMLVRHHHALIDGYGLVSMIRHLFECKFTLPEARFPKVPLWQRALAPLKMPFDVAVMYLNYSDGLKDWHVYEGMPKELVASMSAPIPVERVKTMKNKLRVGYNAVIHSAISGAIARMLKEEKQKVPDYIGVHYPVPNPNHPGGTVNHAFLVGLDWQLKAGSAQERLTAINQAMKDLSRSTVPEMEQWLLTFQIFWPAFLRKLAFLHLLVTGSAVVSTFPATQDIIYFEGLKVADMFSSFGAIAQLSLTVLITGINGKQHVVLTGNKNVFRPEAFQSLGDYIEHELDALMPQ